MLQRRAASMMPTIISDEALGHLAYQSFASRREEHVLSLVKKCLDISIVDNFSGLLFRLSMDIVCRRTRQSDHLDLPSRR